LIGDLSRQTRSVRPDRPTTGPYQISEPVDGVNKAYHRPLSSPDRQEIVDLIYRYSYTYDAKDLDGWLSLFLENATWSVYEPNSSVPAFVLKSNDERRQFAEQRLKELAEQGIQTRHYMTNTLLNKISERRVKGVTMLLLSWQYTSEASPHLINTGYYRDEFVKTKHGWIFASREFHGDQSLAGATYDILKNLQISF